MSRNADVAALLEEMAAHLEARDVDYKPNVYRRAAESIRGHTVAVETLYEEGGEDALTEIDDVGDAIAGKTAEYIETGDIEELADLREGLPVEMDALTAVEGVGPKTVASLYDALEIETLDDLEAAAEAGEIQTVSGFGEKTEQNILKNIPFARESRARSLLGEARPLADRIVEYVESMPVAEAVETAGSIRRWRPTVGDVDVLVGSADREAVIEAFTDWPAADAVIEAGTNKASVRSNGVRVDLRVVDPDSFGAALQYFTGSKDHNVAVRNRAIDHDLKLNEYGVFDISDIDDPDAGQRVGDRVAGESEAGVYEAVGMAWVPPEIRENRGEVDAAAEESLPDLLEEADIRGDLHLHTTASDGQTSVEGMAEAAAEYGHEYIAVADHATGPGMVGGVGLTDEELFDLRETVRAVDDSASIDVFAGVEANIGEDGSISVSEDVLEALDCVVASPHSGLDGDGTDRLVAAIEHPEVDIIGHPTGRLLNQRPGHDVDIERVASAAADSDTALEINANPHRLDLRSSYVKAAIEAGATIAINTDAHRPGAYDYMRFGVHTGRRGWAEPDDVLNCRDSDGVRAFLE
ncbi:DNA-directed DNA polymerase X [Natronomonas pharaonis DSM 2160]|uniref:DNA polymerase beta n=1 Tax=Natronomonas pharaonis (strain ATCC 35678 / DSM 2160 / CIP 103997 / JCM 8858 / NBRC 14720 / NCIMB 2260 / Gabara) TaxID=348780 RepID=A0A1U7EU92_NATPD|nr:DNA polymerase/3'-5' exonuclease PolX [Natronomonas pharaonis]CAI48518.1 DNA-directed DNA polymerase X [Natronomonas pharaonis DSM 2160]